MTEHMYMYNILSPNANKNPNQAPLTNFRSPKYSRKINSFTKFLILTKSIFF